jgi:2,4-dienoyl-CoA reductase-like NADH-dependent reductase (Old Yellow Enzyme family)
MGTPDWGPSRELGVLYEELADGDVGLLITGAAFVRRHKNFHPSKRVPIPLAMDDDKNIKEWRRITDNVHEHGAKIAMQITHPGPRDNSVLRGGTPVAPSDVRDESGSLVARAMSVEEIRETVDDFVQACRRVKESGFDAVQMHGGHGFLISSFISPYMNKRADRYGGSIENRARFITEIVEQAREFVGTTYPVMIKMNCDDFVPGGLTADEAARMAQVIVEAGISCIEVTGGLPESKDLVRSLKSKPLRNWMLGEACFRNLGLAIKEAVEVPVILVGGMRTPSIMEKIIEDGAADFISMSRPLIREPALISRWRSGDLSRARCISCGQCLDSVLLHPLRCYAENRPNKVESSTEL